MSNEIRDQLNEMTYSELLAYFFRHKRGLARFSKNQVTNDIHLRIIEQMIKDRQAKQGL